MKKIILISLFLLLFLVPVFSFAGTYYLESGEEVKFDGFVPCGKPVKVNGDYPNEVCTPIDDIPYGFSITENDCGPGFPANYVLAAPEFPCQLCHIFIVFKEIIIFLLLPGGINGGLPIVLLIALIMIIYGGVLFFFSGGSPENIKKGKNTLKSTGIALFIIYGAWVFIGFFFNVIGAVKLVDLPAGWFQINCPIKFKQFNVSTITSIPLPATCGPVNTFNLSYEIVGGVSEIKFYGCNNINTPPKEIKVIKVGNTFNPLDNSKIVCNTNTKTDGSYECFAPYIAGKYNACREWILSGNCKTGSRTTPNIIINP